MPGKSSLMRSLSKVGKGVRLATLEVMKGEVIFRGFSGGVGVELPRGLGREAGRMGLPLVAGKGTIKQPSSWKSP